MWNMEDMDIDQVVEIPDTPDRVVARRGIGREIVRRDSGSLLHGNFRNKDTNGLRPTDKLVMDNRQHARRPLIYPARRHRNPETTNSSNLNAFNSSDNSSASQKDRLFRRPASDRSHSHRANRSSGVRNMDKGKSIYTGRSSGYQDGDNIFDLTKQNDNSEDRNTVSYGAPEHIVADDKRRGQIALHGTSFGPCIRDSSEMFRNDFKGKEKIDENTLRSSGLATVRGEAVNTSTDSQHKACERSSPRYITLRYPGKKSLVRNGCISPQNIAKAEQLKNTSENIRRSHAENGVSNPPHSPGNIMDIVAEENDRERGKGKAVLTVPGASENQSRGSYSSLATHNEEENGISDTSTDVFGSGGWRSTHNNLRNIEHSTNDTARPLSRRTGSSRSLFSRRHEYGVNRRDIGSGQNPESECDHAVGQTAALRDTFVSETERSSRAPRPDTALNKRLKKIGSSSRNHGECSTSVSEDLDAVLLGSSRESMDTRSSRFHHSQSRAISDPVIDVDAFSPPVDSVIDVDAFSPPVRRFTPQTLDTSSNDDSEGRARQVEADEILARELQEQLYQEAPLGRSGNIDAEYMAWLMQQEDDESNTSGARENESHPRNFVTSHPHRQPRLRTSLNRSNRTHNQSIRRGAQARVPGSSRMAQLRGRIDRQRPAVSTRARNLNFPLGMDLDMRLDILEALEDAFGDLSAADFNNHIFQVQQRDFNESDYEMLLALDDHNHQHAGASANQINNLPQSVVQTNNPEEPCAVCLEPPTIGETIRHLPCLHKFHKDCIDPWLGRKSSCPVCKSSIT